MKRALLMIIGSMLAVVPFALGMVGNTTLTRQVPVRVPAQAKAAEQRAEATGPPRRHRRRSNPAGRITAKPVPTPSETKRGRGPATTAGRRNRDITVEGGESDDDSSGRDDSPARGGEWSGRSGSGHGGHDD